MALNIGPGILEQRLGFVVVAELDADFLKDQIGIGLDDLDGLGRQDFEIRDVALDEARGLEADGRTLGPPRGPAAAPHTPCGCLFHHRHVPISPS